MRLLLVQCPRDQAVAAHEAVALGASIDTLRLATAEDGRAAFVVHTENRWVEPLADELRRRAPGAALTVLPHEVMLLEPEDTDAQLQERETAPRGAVEIYLRGIKATGSWSSFLVYAVVAGALAWVALRQSSVFLMVGAVLVAPYPSPALNAALATACGDLRLFGRSLLRYVIALGLGVAVASLLAATLGPPLVTDLMQVVSFVSATTVALPLAAGVVGGLYLTQSEESSLVSATAAGVLVTAALVPAVGVVGIGLVLGEWTMIQRALFLLLLQIVGINVATPLVLWAYRVGPRFAWFDRGRRAIAATLFAASLAALAGMMLWQFTGTLALVRPTVALEAQHVTRQAVAELAGVRLVAADVRFVAARPDEPDLLLGTLYLRPTGEAPPRLEEEIHTRLDQKLRERGYDVVPLVTVTFLEGDRETRRPSR